MKAFVQYPDGSYGILESKTEAELKRMKRAREIVNYILQ